MSRRLAQTRGFFVCEIGYGVSFARPDCTRIEDGIVWAKPDLVRTESLLCDRPRTRAFWRSLTAAFESRYTCAARNSSRAARSSSRAARSSSRAARSSSRVETRCVPPHTRGRDAPRLAFHASSLRRGAARVPP